MSHQRPALFEVHETLTPADHQSHRRYVFDVPPDCIEIEVHVRYSPKFLSSDASLELAEAALHRQAVALASRVGAPRAEQWAANLTQRAETVRIPNLLTISLDDAAGAYRGAGHRQSDDQRLVLRADRASPGLVPGPLPPGAWALTVSAHTLVSPQCDLSIQIGAEIAVNRP
jgi:hypothetical protein